MPHKASSIGRLAYEVAAKDAAWPRLPVVIANLKDGAIVYVSDFAAETFGYTRDELIGQPVEVLIPEDIRDRHAIWRQDAAVPKTRLMGIGRQVIGRRKDGTVFPAHVGLTTTEMAGHQIGIAFVIDLSTIVQVVKAEAELGHEVEANLP